ncbi:MAG: sulfite exporter TauE/SafE family protein [Myxococcota bacterium]
MLALAAILSILMGGTLGLLGGGGSILTVPILVYALGVEAKAAIATSLLVVGVTSLAGMLQHARAGNVRWRTGLLFGAFAMIGSYGGGLLAAHISATVLLLLFAGLMIGTAFAMLRKKAAKDGSATPSDRRDMRVSLVVAEGLLVGGVTGLVGAGGGFLVVPALALLAGLDMRAAVGTSLLVIAMKSLAGFVGHIEHTTVDMTLAGVVTGAAVVGSFAGTALSRRVPQEALRTVFAWFVLVMSGFLVWQEAPPEAVEFLVAPVWHLWVILGVGVAVIGGLLGLRRGRQDASSA